MELIDEVLCIGRDVRGVSRRRGTRQGVHVLYHDLLRQHLHANLLLMPEHPLAAQLHPLHLKKPTMTVQELRAAIDMAQGYVEYWWEQTPPLGFSEMTSPISGPARCASPGCNYRRYPVSRFCMHHASSNDSFAGYLRRRLK